MLCDALCGTVFAGLMNVEWYRSGLGRAGTRLRENSSGFYCICITKSYAVMLWVRRHVCFSIDSFVGLIDLSIVCRASLLYRRCLRVFVHHSANFGLSRRMALKKVTFPAVIPMRSEQAGYRHKFGWVEMD